jgi:hypothetical protein
MKPMANEKITPQMRDELITWMIFVRSFFEFSGQLFIYFILDLREVQISAEDSNASYCIRRHFYSTERKTGRVYAQIGWHCGDIPRCEDQRGSTSLSRVVRQRVQQPLHRRYDHQDREDFAVGFELQNQSTNRFGLRSILPLSE